MNVAIWWQTNSSTLIIEDCDFKVEVITRATKLVFIFVDFVKRDKFLRVRICNLRMCLWLDWLRLVW